MSMTYAKRKRKQKITKNFHNSFNNWNKKQSISQKIFSR